MRSDLAPPQKPLSTAAIKKATVEKLQWIISVIDEDEPEMIHEYITEAANELMQKLIAQEEAEQVVVRLEEYSHPKIADNEEVGSPQSQQTTLH